MSVTRYAKAQVSGNGMVAAAHPLAALAGIDALREGGNAMDACLTMASVTSVVLPYMCGLGGDVFLIYYDAGTETVTALNGSGAPGDKSTLEHFAGTGPILPQDGILSVAVPGAPLAYQLADRRFGTFGLRKCFEAGAKVAEKGFVVSASFARAVAAEKAKLSKFDEAARVFLPGGEPPKPGSVFRQVDMASTLRAFGEGGAEYMYNGPFAEKFYEMNAALDGTFTGDEFGSHFDNPSGFYDPILSSYRGYTILQTAPVSQGFIVLEEMNILETFDMPALDPAGPEAIHLMVEAKKTAFADRNAYAGDPAVSGFDVGKFISKEYARAAAQGIDLRKAGVFSGGPSRGGDTTSFVAWDAKGNCCSFIHSIAFAFGSGVMVPGTGVLLNNRAGRSFVLERAIPTAWRRESVQCTPELLYGDDRPGPVYCRRYSRRRRSASVEHADAQPHARSQHGAAGCLRVSQVDFFSRDRCDKPRQALRAPARVALPRLHGSEPRRNGTYGEDRRSVGRWRRSPDHHERPGHGSANRRFRQARGRIGAGVLVMLWSFGRAAM